MKSRELCCRTTPLFSSTGAFTNPKGRDANSNPADKGGVNERYGYVLPYCRMLMSAFTGSRGETVSSVRGVFPNQPPLHFCFLLLRTHWEPGDSEINQHDLIHQAPSFGYEMMICGV